MSVVRENEYNNDKKEFFFKHKNDFTVKTTGDSAEYYRKTYTFADGVVWYEVSTKQIIEDTIEIMGININVSIDVMQTEYWSSDDSHSKFYYVPWSNKSYWHLV